MTSTASQPASTHGAPRLAVQAASLLMFAGLVDSQIVAAIAPQVASGLHAAPETVALGIGVYSIAAAAVALALARSRRAAHPRRDLPASALMLGVASTFTAASPHVAVFLAGRALAGIAGGLVSALVVSAIANASSYERRGRQMTSVAISYFLAPVLGVPAGALLAGSLGWRAVFVLSALAAFAAGALTRAFALPEASAAATPGAPATERAVRRLWRIGAEPVSARMGVVSAFFVSGGLVGLTAFLGLWLSEAFGATARGIGLVYGVAGVGAVAGGVIGGALADRIGKRRVAASASIVLAVLVLAVPTFAWGPGLFVAVAITAFVASLRVAPLQALVTELVAPEDRAAYVALRNVSSQAGIAAAVGAGGWVFARGGLIGVGAVCALLTVLAWLTIRRIRDPHEAVRPKVSLWRHGARAAVVVVLFVMLVVPWTLSVLVTTVGTRRDERHRPETPASFGATYEDVTFTSADGNTLSGWYLPPSGRDTTIVMTHGLFRSRYELLERGVELWRRGHGVLLYDLRRHGRSPAPFATIGYEERHDVAAAVAFARSRTPDGRVVLFGVSMGAAATLLATAELDGIAAVVAESSFLSLEHTFYHHVRRMRAPIYPFGPILLWATAARLGYMPSSFDVRAAVARIDSPILFIGGTMDDRMPIETVLDPLYAAAPSPRKRKHIVEGATHGHAYSADPAGYMRAVDEFLASVE